MSVLSREDWSKLSWQEAQNLIGQLLQHFEFFKFEEKLLEKSKRADLIVYQEILSETVFGVIEVKSYEKITPKIEENAMEQACGYLSSIYHEHQKSNSWQTKNIRYFVATIFTKDYPNVLKKTESKFLEMLPEDLLSQYQVDLISCTPENLLKILFEKNLVSPTQQSLDPFFS